MENLKNYKVTYSKVFTENIDLYEKSGQKILIKKITTFRKKYFKMFHL